MPSPVGHTTSVSTADPPDRMPAYRRPVEAVLRSLSADPRHGLTGTEAAGEARGPREKRARGRRTLGSVLGLRELGKALGPSGGD